MGPKKETAKGKNGAATASEGSSQEFVQPERDEKELFNAPSSDFKPLARLPVTIHGQYIRDLSFENPKAPHSLRYKDGKPVMDINFVMDARRVDLEEKENMYEVTLGVTATAKRGDKTAFIAEIEYAVLCSIHDVPEESVHPLLLIEMPRHAFPFVRQILATLTQQAGFMPLLLTPVDFRAFYMQRYGQPAEGAASGREKATA